MAIAAQLNGTPNKAPIVPDDKAAMNGQANGSIHHRTHPSSRSSRSKRKSKQSFAAWTADKALKVAVWYTIITLVFRCPTAQTSLTDNSPRICKPSLQLRDSVTPYTQPYYDEYLSPYVQRVQPYIDQFNTRLYKPSLAVYEKHGAPRVADAQNFGQEQWKKTVKPQLEVVQKETGKQYETHLGPYVKRAQDVVQPFYDSVKTSAVDVWELELEPVYHKTRPYAAKVYVHAREFAVKTVLPQAQFVGSTTWTVWTRHIWPRMRILYGENVEPQLVRITERLGRYKDGKKLEADIMSMETSSKLAEASASASDFAASVSSSVEVIAKTPTSAISAAGGTAVSSPQSVPDIKIQFQEDLKSWEHICAKAVQEGSEDLKERIQDITDVQVKSTDGVGSALVTQLEQATGTAMNSVKARIQQIVRNLPEDAEERQIEDANDELVLAIRTAGQNIKQRAQAVREWRQYREIETTDLVEKALQSTLETIEHIRDLRLTEIGRKYASSSLPHKEWSKYNDLKKAPQDWRNKVEKSAHAHHGISKAKSAREDIEQQAMAIAEDAAKELGRLKEVGKWKIAANESSDDFSTRYIPPPVRKAHAKVVEQVAAVSQVIMGEESEQGSVESASSVASEKASRLSENVIGSSTGSLESAASKVSEKIIGSKHSTMKSMGSKASEFVESAATAASESVVGSESSLSDSATEAASSISSAILGESGLSDSATQAASDSSSVVIESVKTATKSVNSKLSSMLSAQKANKQPVSQSARSLVDEADKSGSSLAEQVVDSSSAASKMSASVSAAASEATSKASAVVSAISEAVPGGEDIADAAERVANAATEKPKKVMGGAMAQILVDAREPILDDVVDGAESFSKSIHSMASVAGDKASELTQAVQDALKKATATPGMIESVTSLANEQYESAIAAASSVLFGTQKGVIEQGSSAAREQYEAAVIAASYAIYGTPITAAPFAHASSVYDNAVSEAARHYEHVKSRLSEQFSGTPEPIHQRMFSSAESAYSAAIGAASDRLHEATRTQNAYESISSVAAARLSDAAAAASAQYKSAKIAVGAEPTPVHEQYLASARKTYYEALGFAHGRYSEFLDAASSVFTQAPMTTGISQRFDSAMSDARSGYSVYVSEAQSKYSALLSMATAAASAQGESAIGKDTMSTLQEQLADASSIASSNLAAASSDISVAIYGTEQAITESIASRASENWEALISKASEQVYGAPLPFTESVASRVNEYATHATEAAAAQWEAVSGLFAELITGKEPDFTESVYSRLQSAYSTKVPDLMSQASSAASIAYESAFSVVSAAFVPPTQVPGIVEQMQERLNAAVEAASTQVYGTSKGTIEHATEVAASVYGEAASQVSQAVYGKEANFVEAAQSNIADIGASASSAIRDAIYGSPTDTMQAASSVAASVYSSIASQASEQASAASAAVSRAIYGEEQTYLEGVQSQLSVAVASASSRISELSAHASKTAGDTANYVSSAAAEAAGSISSAAGEAAGSFSSIVSEATGRVRDEL